MNKVLSWIENNQEHQIALLAKAVSFPSVSSWLPTHTDAILNNIDFFIERLNTLKFKTEKRENPIGKSFPPIIVAKSLEDPKKKTVLIYGHIDVQPAAESDGWDSSPWVLTEREGKLYGRGSTDDKGPVLAWTNAIEAFRECSENLPVNVRFLIESMEESGSVGLEELLMEMKKNNDTFLQNIDYCVISDNYWLGNNKACIAYGLRGIAQFTVEIKCANKDMHSGSCGSLVSEAMTDLIWLLNHLVSLDGTITIPKIYDEVLPMNNDVENYDQIEFDIKERQIEIGNEFIHNGNKSRLLQGLWRLPSLSIHGIEGAFSEKGFKTVIPAKVIGKFSIRTVPNMTAEHTKKKVLDHLQSLWNARNSSNAAKFICVDTGDWYFLDPRSPSLNAAISAVEEVYGTTPDLIREGGSIPITVIIAKCTGKDVCLLPLGCANDGAHSQNEKIDLVNYIKGCKVMAVYLSQLASLQKENAPQIGGGKYLWNSIKP